MENKKLNKLMNEILNGLTDEQKEKVKTCVGLDEIAACLGEMGVALPDELLDAVAGGYIDPSGRYTAEEIEALRQSTFDYWKTWGYSSVSYGTWNGSCPKCGSTDFYNMYDQHQCVVCFWTFRVDSDRYRH